MSNILIVGASGFIGKNLATALSAAGHKIICGLRHLPPPKDLEEFAYFHSDYTNTHLEADLKNNLSNVDVVINAVGIFRENNIQTFEALHKRGPKTLFSLCAASGIPIIQISALGADKNANTPYHISKKAADDFLLSVTNKAVIIQPSLVYGVGGVSAKFFNIMASLPIIPLPGKGDQTIQPTHIADLTQAIVNIINHQQFFGQHIPLVGAKALTLREYLSELRSMLELGPGKFIHIPTLFVELGARIGKKFPIGIFDGDAWKMLKRGNTANCEETIKLLNHSPRSVKNFASAEEAKNFRICALLSWLKIVLRISLAAVWVVAGVVSLGVYPIEESYALLGRVGITGVLAPITLYAASLIDLYFGLATLFLKQRKLLWIAQSTLIITYTIVITIFLPEFRLHPFGPLIKNLPILAIIFLLYKLEEN